MNIKSVLLAIAAFALSSCALKTKTPAEDAVSIKVSQLLAQMTVAEKVGQMTQVDFALVAAPKDKLADYPVDTAKLETAILKYHVGSILNTPYDQAQPLATWRQISLAVQQTTAQSRLKIPVIYGIDAIHGATYLKGATLFPQAINMAATFNPELSFQEGEITARELRTAGLLWNFSPVMDIGRQPLWPRLWETYGEDVQLASILGSAYIKGHQGNDFAAPDKAATCLKHFVGYSFPITGRDRTPAWLGERMLREYFLPTFAAGIKAGSPTVMVNSGEVDGIPGHANYRYLTTILREEMGFKGFVVSDWEDIKRLYTRDKVAASPREAVKMAVMAGVDMSMVPYDFSFSELLLDLVNSHEVPMSRIDEAVSRILTVKYQTGLFGPAQTFLPAAANFATPAAAASNRQAARESIVLAKNAQSVLPLKKSANILVTGPTANLRNVLNGGWTITWQGSDESVYPQDQPTVLEALKTKATGKIGYVEGSSFDTVKDIDKVLAELKNYDYVLLCLGEKPYTETLGNIDSLALEPAQMQLATAVLAAGKPVVLLMLGGRPRLITPIAEQAAGVVLGFLPGMEGAAAIADILYGDYNPDGRLPISYPKHANSFNHYDHKPAEAFENNTYDPLYPFGHGLSYSTFVTRGLTLEKNRLAMGENLKLSVQVANTGPVKGKETVLVYLRDVAASVSRPNKQLKAFKKVELTPGQSETLHFTLTPDDLSFIGVDLQRLIEPGDFTVMVGNETAAFSVAP
ncbi:glycoside hydrolase family 3 N-terminal domain-containing protein [Methylovulum psychrotolerans]|uniref:beta-glucosidase n=1 Tax=Methylovulum psychrotolerans TaxID=1704499 RepID=A0A2S5CMY6_9GAMM|nr:glycoside hydrolase family 3 N-terminal domain-containing protein [Methylovulum psychrotolerans]POZ52185.1 beta-glucosidase [Methylovulum psychrotolerans]